MRTATQAMNGALDNTAPTYWEALCRSRAGKDPDCQGSRFPHFAWKDVDKLVRQLVWEPYTHASIKEPAIGLIAPSVPGGELGVLPLADVYDDAELVWLDPKRTGLVELIWLNPPPKVRPVVDYVIALLGPNEQGKESVWTFHPGDPVSPSQVERHWWGDNAVKATDRHGRTSSKAEAATLGVQWVKL